MDAIVDLTGSMQAQQPKARALRVMLKHILLQAMPCHASPALTATLDLTGRTQVKQKKVLALHAM